MRRPGASGRKLGAQITAVPSDSADELFKTRRCPWGGIGFARQHRSGRGDGVGRVGLAVTAPLLAVRAVDLERGPAGFGQWGEPGPRPEPARSQPVMAVMQVASPLARDASVSAVASP